MKNSLQGNSVRVNEAKNQISDMEHKEAKNNQSEQQEEKRIRKNKDSVSSLWDSFKRSNTHNIDVPGEMKEQEIGNLFEKIVRENFPNLVKEIDMQVQEAQTVTNKGCKEAHSKTHLIKRLKIKRKS